MFLVVLLSLGAYTPKEIIFYPSWDTASVHFVCNSMSEASVTSFRIPSEETFRSAL